MRSDALKASAVTAATTRVVILAGGAGVRLRPYSTFLPKPMMPVGDMPILEVMLRQLASQGFRRITLSVNHLAELVRAFFGDGGRLGLEIDYYVEDVPLGTAGSLALIEDLSDPFLALNGDLLTTLDYRAPLAGHVTSGAEATIAAIGRRLTVDFGVLETDPSGDLRAYVEKPTLDLTVSMGVNVLAREVLKLIPRGGYLDVPDLIGRLLGAGRRVITYCAECEWLDIGRAEDHEQALKAFAERRGQFLPGGG
jgi:NDP-sugar pyrophosphorylase family protein